MDGISGKVAAQTNRRIFIGEMSCGGEGGLKPPLVSGR